MSLKTNLILLVFLLIIGSITHAQKRIKKTDAAIHTTVFYSSGPLFKRMPFGPMAAIRIALPQKEEVRFKSIRMQLDQNAIKAIDKIELIIRDESKRDYLDGAKILASVKPNSAVLDIPFDLVCKPGLSLIRISAVLKDDANIDKKINVKINFLVTENGTKQYIDRFMELGSSGFAVSPDFQRNGAYIRTGIAIRKKWDDSVHTYRIPGLITTGKGTLIAVYDIRYEHAGDLPANIDVGISRSTDGGKTWEPMKIIMDMGPPHKNNGIGDPAVLYDPATKKIWVAALWSKGNRSIAGSMPGLSPDTTGQFMLVSSDDDGLTWSQPYSITPQVKDIKWHLYFNGPGNGIVMQNGTLVFPSQYWDESKKPGLPHSSIIYSEDKGKTWKSGTGAKSNTTEAQVVETTPGTLMLNMRDNRGRFRSVATTNDMGKTWIEHHTSQLDLPDPISMASFIRAEVNVKGNKKDVLFFSNVSSQTIRQNTTIKASLDMGKSWPAKNHLLLDTRTTYGYSALTKIDDNTIGILYEGDNGELYFLRVPVSDIIK